MKQMYSENGFVLITTMFLLSLLLALLGAYYVTSNIELATTRFSRNSVTGFYTAEAGLNIRAEQIRSEFVGYNRPSGASPDEDSPCTGTNMGSGDFACENFTFDNHSAVTYLSEDPTNPVILTIPPGELYQNLNAQEYRYSTRSIAHGVSDKVEAILELRFKSRLVPLFQFAAFYNKDLEILPGPTMTLEGPVHTNGDLYLNANTSLAIDGQVSAAGDIYRGRKNDSSCMAKPITVPNPSTPTAILPSCSTRTKLSSSLINQWNGMIQSKVDILTVPEPEVFDPSPGQVYWDKADLRLVFKLDASNNPVTTNSPYAVEVRDTSDNVDTALTTKLTACQGAINETAAGANNGQVVNNTYTFYNNREGKLIRMLEVDMRGLLNCVHTQNLFGPTKQLDDDSEGGIVFHFTVKGPESNTLPNRYGIRIRNAAKLQSTIAGAPVVQGMTVVSDQAIYTHGNYNSTSKIPAALMGDSFNVLSNNWNLNDSKSTLSLSNRVPSDTTINSAILAGTDSTGGVDGVGGQGGDYNGGLENYPRFHEDWSKSPQKTLTYRGSFVSLNKPRFANGGWVYGGSQYTAPIRDWHYDTDFNDAANLPPITPRFVYLRQELFVRDFEQ
jgi:hypothetical protein